MLHSSSQKAKSFLSENALHHIAGNICFPSCTTVHVEHSFREMRTQSHLSPDMHADYASRRPSCNKNLYSRCRTLFRCVLNTQSHYTGRTIHEKETVQRTDKAVLLRPEEHGYERKGKGRFTSRSKKCEALC